MIRSHPKVKISKDYAFLDILRLFCLVDGSQPARQTEAAGTLHGGLGQRLSGRMDLGSCKFKKKYELILPGRSVGVWDYIVRLLLGKISKKIIEGMGISRGRHIFIEESTNDLFPPKSTKYQKYFRIASEWLNTCWNINSMGESIFVLAFYKSFGWKAGWRFTARWT